MQKFEVSKYIVKALTDVNWRIGHWYGCPTDDLYVNPFDESGKFMWLVTSVKRPGGKRETIRIPVEFSDNTDLTEKIIESCKNVKSAVGGADPAMFAALSALHRRMNDEVIFERRRNNYPGNRIV